MVRFTVFALCLAAGPVFAQSALERSCATMAKATGQLIEHRKAGLDQLDALKDVMSDRKIKRAKGAEALPGIAAWVYTLSEEELESDVAEAFEVQCNAQKG